MVKIVIAKEFSEYPGGRYISDGPNSGERFRLEFLVPALEKYEQVTIVLDGTKGYPSSFLEEAFGGVVRNSKFSAKELHHKIKIIAENIGYKHYVDAIWKYIDMA